MINNYSLPPHLPAPQYELIYEAQVSPQDALRIYYLPESRVIITRSVGFVFGEELKKFLNEIIIFMQKRKLNKLIVDLTYREPYTDEDQQWIDNNWFPRALAAGLTHFGYVVAKDLFMQFSAEEILERRKGSVTLAPFGELEAAQKWIAAF
ncbi:hypothetical protein [Hugenholtzia roseola]|uniref:hypothetical protein n=1 Tax=Hugenholtzia roseola TaxID=1002 RepID=UPI0004048ACF|nr:hypothetical protein [Hugenholtzia roseola]